MVVPSQNSVPLIATVVGIQIRRVMTRAQLISRQDRVPSLIESAVAVLNDDERSKDVCDIRSMMSGKGQWMACFTT